MKKIMYVGIIIVAILMTIGLVKGYQWLELQDNNELAVTVGKALVAYRDEHQGSLPQSWDELRKWDKEYNLAYKNKIEKLFLIKEGKVLPANDKYLAQAEIVNYILKVEGKYKMDDGSN